MMSDKKSVLGALLAFLDAAADAMPKHDAKPGDMRLLTQIAVEIPCEVYDAMLEDFTELVLVSGVDMKRVALSVPEVTLTHPKDDGGTFRMRRCPDGTFASEYGAVIKRGRDWMKEEAIPKATYNAATEVQS